MCRLLCVHVDIDTHMCSRVYCVSSNTSWKRHGSAVCVETNDSAFKQIYMFDGKELFRYCTGVQLRVRAVLGLP
jgi:hypothetical protein